VILAENGWGVKLAKNGEKACEARWQLPGAVWGAFERDAAGHGVNVADAAGGLIDAEEDVFGVGAPFAGAGDGIEGNFAQIAGRYQVADGLRRCLLVEGELLDGVAHGLQVLFVMNAKQPEHTRALLEKFGMPFEKGDN